MVLEQGARKAKRGSVVAAMIAAVIASGPPAHAQNLVAQSQPTGGAAMLGMRISFGGELPFRRSARFGLTFGSYWRDVPGSAQFAGYRFLPTAEVGLTLSGEAVLKLGPIQIRRAVNGLGVDEPQREEGFCARNVKLCVAGVFLGLALIFLLADEKGYKEPCIDGNGCPT
jgi:hypothetical protein